MEVKVIVGWILALVLSSGALGAMMLNKDRRLWDHDLSDVHSNSSTVIDEILADMLGSNDIDEDM